MAAFRECYSKLYELRSLAPRVPMVALTATATKLTGDTILSLLNMENVVEIKLNVAYVVQYMDKDTELEFYFSWLTDELKQSQEKTDRTIIYCQTIRQCGLVYATIKGLLGTNMFIGEKMCLLKCCIRALLKKIRGPFWSRFNLKMVLSVC